MKKTLKYSITNHYSYIIPVKLRQNDKLVENKLNFKGVKIGQHDFQNVVKAKLQNPQPEILRELTLKGEITKKGKKEVLYSEKREGSKLAPNSNFSYTIPLGKDKFKAGDYTLTLSAKAKGLNEKWTEDFSISATEAKELNDQLFTYEKKTPWWYYLVAVIVMLIVIGIIVFVVQNQKHQKKLESEIADLVAKGSKNDKKKRKKAKNRKSLLIPLLLISYGSTQVMHAAENDSGKSDAAIYMYKEKGTANPDAPDTPKEPSQDRPDGTDNNKTSTYDKKQSDIGGGKQVTKQVSIPQLSENFTDRIAKFGCVLVLGTSLVIVIMKKKRKESMVD